MYQKDLKIRKRILISGIGGEIAQGVSRIIRENFPSCEVHGSDCEARHSGKLFADKLLKLPKASLKKKYIFNLNSYIKKNKIDLFIPISDKEINLFILNKKKNKSKKIHCSLKQTGKDWY